MAVGHGASKATNKPKPFSRPSISITPPDAPKRLWVSVPAQEVKQNDVVADFGTVEEKWAVGNYVRFENGDRRLTVPVDQPVFAFTVVPNVVA